jgi:hypothetical protein
MSKQLGILFKPEMVRAILEGRKTQTRRVIKSDANNIYWNPIMLGGKYGWTDEHGYRVKCNWRIGDYLYVRETWGVGTRPDPFQGWIDGIEYRADEAYLDEHDDLPLNPVAEFDYGSYTKTGWQPSLFMPKIISRIWLKVTNVRVERLLDISDDDAIAEGIDCCDRPTGGDDYVDYYRDYMQPPKGDDGWPWIEGYPNKSYFSLWDSINGAGSHQLNPWVWVIEFERCEKP